MVGKSDQGLLLFTQRSKRKERRTITPTTLAVSTPPRRCARTRMSPREKEDSSERRNHFSLRHSGQHHHREMTLQTRPHTLNQEAPQRSKEQRDAGIAQGEGGRLCRMCFVGRDTYSMNWDYVVLRGVVGCAIPWRTSWRTVWHTLWRTTATTIASLKERFVHTPFLYCSGPKKFRERWMNWLGL